MESNTTSENNKALIKGTIIYAIGNLGTKILNFLIVPLYTYYISTADMGEYDLLTTNVALLSPFISMRISEGTYNWLIKDRKEDYVTIKATYNYLLKSCLLSSLVLIFIGRFVNIWNLKYFLIILILDPILETTQKILRGFKNQKLFAASGIFYTGLLVSLNFISVCILRKGVVSILFNTIVSQASTIIMIFALEKRLRCLNIKVERSILFETQKELLKYSAPLIPSTLSWWVMSVSDRYVIKFFLGSSFNGIYAVASKFPSVLQTIFVLFNNSWTDMALANFDDENSNIKYISNLFRQLYTFSFSIVLFLIPATKAFTKLILSSDYKIGSVYIGYLYLGAIFQGFSSFISVGYLQKQKTGKVAISSAFGAAINLLIDLLFVQHIGLYAAAISTYAGFFTMWLVRMYDLRDIWPIKVNIKEFLLWVIISTAISTITIWTNIKTDLFLTCIFATAFLLINKSFIKTAIGKFKNKRNK